MSKAISLSVILIDLFTLIFLGWLAVSGVFIVKILIKLVRHLPNKKLMAFIVIMLAQPAIVFAALKSKLSLRALQVYDEFVLTYFDKW